LDYLLVDAFSSDTIPIHLMPREAIALYMSRLREDGLLAIHISNRHLELGSVVASLAKDAGLSVKLRNLVIKPTSLGDAVPSSAAVFARRPETLAAFTEEGGWKQPATNNVPVWTDDYSNILGAIWRKYAN
ncbi:MAG TPA: class I SAM-dependent methyltransferase, partial [Aestuariivirga sp.]|nr:class I SAM-dependent methyltransferase [Aestuariivirga sp.]